MLPPPVLERAAAELPDWHGTGMSVMEMSHRGREFGAIAQHAEARLRELLAVPDDYRVLFLQGGATLQFAAVPLNLLPLHGRAGYVHSGAWAKKAIAEARRYGDVAVCWDGAESSYTTLPSGLDVPERLAYLHLTSNETIGGVQWREFPSVEPPLVADMSSDILSRPLDVSRFGLVYAGAQKNIGPAGLTVVIVRGDLVGHAREETPSAIDYGAQAEAGSMLNTPPTYAIYVAGLVFDWLAGLGGLEAVAARNAEKASLLYGTIDESGFYASPVDPAVRSAMNVPFRLADPELEPVFLAEAAEAGLRELKGHRSVGGVRASLYNAMPLEGVQALVELMREFERRHG
jgi:phosphoserine aminotransferase